MPTIVSGGPNGDHSRKSSVHIKQTPPTSGAPSNIKFGSLAGSPAPAPAMPVAQGSNLNPQAQNPRVASPAHSPSPIPTPISGGPKPDSLPTRPNLVFGGNGSESADSNRPVMPTQSNQPPHMRRESSQSSNQGFQPNGGRGRGFHPQQHYNPAHGSPQPFRPIPNQPMGGRGMPAPFTPQGLQNSPYRSNRSPALTPAQMHQQQHFANPQGQPFYPGQQYPQQNMYGMPPQGLDPYNNYYGQPAYGLQQSIHYPGVPASPGRGHGFPQQIQNPYSMPGPYGQPPQGQSMSRTPSQMSERPPSAVPQPSTPAMTNVNHHTHTPSVTSASPAPSSSAFERPKKKSAAIVIKNADGEVVDFNKSKGAASPAPNAAPAAPVQSKSPAIAATPTPPPRAPSASDAARTEEAPVKSASEKKADFVKQFQEKLRLQEEADKKAKDDADNEAKAAAEAEQKKKDEAKAAEEKAAQEAKAKEEAAAKEAKEAEEKAAQEAKEAKEKEEAAAAAKSSEDDEAEKKRKEEEEFERMVAEMEAEEARREEEEKRYAEEQKRKKAEEAAKAGDKIKAQEEALRKAEREAEAAELARENETPEQKAEREAKDKEMFASLKKNTMFGPGATGEEPSEDSAPPAAAPAPAAKPVSATKPKPAALKLETNKPVEPAQPTAGMESLKTARFIQVRNEAINYPEGIQSPNPALNQGSKSKGRQYDKDFLLQFQEVFKEKPSIDWDLKLKETVGDGSDQGRTSSVRGTPVSGRAPSGRAGMGGAGGMGNFGQGGAFGSRTLPPGTTSEQRFQQASGRGTMTNPLAPFVQGGSQRGGFPMAPGMARSSSFQPNSPRVGSQGGRGDRSRRGGGGQKNAQAEAKTMPLTAGKEIKSLEQTSTGWKPHGSEKQVITGHMAPDMVQRKVKAALNKMTPEKFDKISDQILEIAAQSKDETDGRTLRQVIQLTFEKACDEAHWSSMYAKFCYKMLNTMSHDIKDERVLDKQGNPVVGGALFRKYLLNRCQEEFERGWEVNLPEAPEEGKEATMLSDEYYIAAAAKRKGLGLIQFIGELYKLGMLTLRIMHECVLKLLDFEGLPDESAIESLVKLLRTVGATMEAAEAGPKMINMYFERVEKVMNMEGLPSRLRFMLLDTIDMRKSGWKSKDVLKGPKTIAEIHQEAVAAQQAADMERTRSQRGGGAGRPPLGRGDARSFSGGGMLPPQDTGGRVQMDDLRKLSKGASARGLSNTGSLGPSMLGSRSGSGRRGLGPGMMGRGGDESGNSSRTGTPPVKEKSTASLNAFDALAALEADNDNAGEVSSPPPAAAETDSKPSE
jgi:translation initiation factor 4G